jgi:hypothetical protein
MKKLTYVLAILAAASTAAVAKDLKQDKKATAAPAVTATQMSDSEMDKVTAGDTGLGLFTACCETNTSVFGVNHATIVPGAGVGTLTASGQGQTPF